MKILKTPWTLATVGVLVITSAFVRSVVTSPPEESTFLFLGDTLLGDRAEPMLEENGYSWAFEKLPDLGAPDLTILNAEGPLTDRYEVPADVYYWPGSPTARYDITTSRGLVTRYIYRSSPRSADAFRSLGVDLATLSNNHVLDQGRAGLADTQAALAASGVIPIGGGQNASEAAKPYIYETPSGRVAVFSFGEVGATSPDATAETAGIRGLTTANVDAAVTAARAANAQWWIAVVHWGNNYEPVLETQEVWARRLEGRGFDLIVGHGPHLAQPITRLGNTPVVYSVGNFVFLTEGRYDVEHEGFSLAVTAVLGTRGFRELRVTCLQTDNTVVQYQTRACTDADAQRVLPGLVPGIVVEGAVGTIKW